MENNSASKNIFFSVLLPQAKAEWEKNPLAKEEILADLRRKADARRAAL